MLDVMMKTASIRVLPGLAIMGLLGCRPDVPHPVSSESDDTCRKCHLGDGRAGAPSSGHGKGKSGCTSCHDTTSRGTYPALMPHRGGDEANCVLCHKDGAIGAPISKHVAEADCYTCHEAAEYGAWPPTVPLEVSPQDDETCLRCHPDAKHPERKSCTTCHKI
jgi:hypothetical protein